MFRNVRLTKKTYLLAILALVMVLTLAIASPVMAAESITDDAHAVLGEDEVVDDDLFIVGQTVEVLGTVKGDLFATGQYVTVRGVVEGNLFVAGQVVMVGGRIDGSAHTAGYAVFLDPDTVISRNLYFGGFSYASAPDSMVERSFYGGGYQFKVDGDTGRDLNIGGGAVDLQGLVGGDALIDVEVPADGGASQDFNPSMMAPMPPGVSIPMVAVGANIPEENVSGERNVNISYYETVNAPAEKEIKPDTGKTAALVLANRMRKTAGEAIALLIVGGLMLAYMFGWTEKVVEQVRSKPLPSLGWGVLVYILLVPAVMVLLFLVALVVLLLSMVTLGELTGMAISISGLGIGALLTGFGLLAGWVAKVIISYLIGYMLLKQISAATLEGKWGKFLALLIGVVLYELLRFIPVGGFIVLVAVTLFGVGAVFSMYYDKYMENRIAAA